MSQPATTTAGATCPVDDTLRPPRWAPTPIRRPHTDIGYLKSWWLALKAIRAGYRHTIYDYPTELAQDDIVVTRAPPAKFVVVHNPDIARLLTLFGYGFLLGVSRPLRWRADQLAKRGPQWLAARAPRMAINELRRGAWVIAPRARRGLG